MINFQWWIHDFTKRRGTWNPKGLHFEHFVCQSMKMFYCKNFIYVLKDLQSSQVFTIDKGTARGTTFKIDTGGFVFSCLFDSGAEISCMNMDTVATLGLLGMLIQSSVTVNMASRQNMGEAGDVQVNFKIDRKFSFTHRFVGCENLTRPLY